VLASLAVIILNLAAQTSLQALRSPPHSEGDVRKPLTMTINVEILSIEKLLFENPARK